MTEQTSGPMAGSYWVKSGRLMAGPYPAAWYTGTNQFRYLDPLLSAGITYFLDLTKEDEASDYKTSLLSLAAARAIEVTHQRMSIPDMEVPTHAGMIDILNTIDTALILHHNVYVHCLGGIGRTGTVIGCWLVRHGLTGQAALDEIVRLRGGRRDSPQTTAQFDMVRNWNESG